MEFSGHLTIDRPGVVDQLRARLPDQLAGDGFKIFSAVPLRASRKLSWFERFRTELRRTGGRMDFSVRMAGAVRFEMPLGETGTLAYTISNPHHGRVLGLFVLIATLTAYFADSFFAALFVALIGSGAIGIALHYRMRRSVVRYLRLLPSQYSNHRLSMG
ncbi:hypothetical protein HFP51_11855 [Parasphingopyxis sp. CP4]|uniref:hypothetical protein n=1 Tax=Parasphingopyxis sp. CP4 TaxID=2724527 RepID=UPI0015A31239|nr:hypothetical protein [Parasphingopyxis sp. CP4]QLC22813.1 hypothetical protein HFP51_11855 [Parasphingopyxis sp. CP4]